MQEQNETAAQLLLLRYRENFERYRTALLSNTPGNSGIKKKKPRNTSLNLL